MIMNRSVNRGGGVGHYDPPAFENFVVLVNKIEKNVFLGIF
jgi:hypothetical protein